jgi:hypothetical protein
MLHEYSENYLRVKKWRAIHKEQRKLQSQRHYQRHRQQVRARHRKWREANPNYFHDYYKKTKQHAKIVDRAWMQKNREKLLEQKKQYYQEHKDEINARDAARYNVPLGPECELCGSRENLERHHPDYNEPLFIVTLCTSCHRTIHASK